MVHVSQITDIDAVKKNSSDNRTLCIYLVDILSCNQSKKCNAPRYNIHVLPVIELDGLGHFKAIILTSFRRRALY